MRRIYNPTQYEFLQHQQHWNVFMTSARFMLGAAQILFVVQLLLVACSPAPRRRSNPWNANTLEWTAASPPPHCNWGPTLPTVYRGPYEYSVPEVAEDFLPQTAGAGARAGGAALSAGH